MSLLGGQRPSVGFSRSGGRFATAALHSSSEFAMSWPGPEESVPFLTSAVLSLSGLLNESAHYVSSGRLIVSESLFVSNRFQISGPPGNGSAVAGRRALVDMGSLGLTAVFTPTPADESNADTILIGVLAGVAGLILIIIVVVLVLRATRRNQSQPTKYSPSSSSFKESDSEPGPAPPSTSGRQSQAPADQIKSRTGRDDDSEDVTTGGGLPAAYMDYVGRVGRT
jgi:hypothetical protein